ncbi:MAG: YsnF/AvaK domain-containing protein [Chloroflexota bacterium]|nr:YsnF/AvaK domain-containing protein [Chloroflexota bacterium]
MTTTNTPRGSTVVGVFHDRERAREAIEALKADGFSSDSISILSPDRQATEEIAEGTGTHAGTGAATGAVTGGLLGGIGGWLVGIGALAIPGVGPFIAAGAFASALGGAAIGAGIGAIAGALTGMGVPEEDAKYYEGEAKSGKTLVTVRADGRYDDAQRILRQNDAYDVDSRGAPVAPAGVGGVQQPMVGRNREMLQDRDTLQLREEELVARKQNVQTGEVQLGKEVVSEQRTIDVPVTREEVTIERTPVDRRPTDRPLDERTESISVPVREEQVDVEKRAVVYEEVGLGKRAVQETEEVSETVRREQARIEHDGDVTVDNKKS